MAWRPTTSLLLHVCVATASPALLVKAALRVCFHSRATILNLGRPGCLDAWRALPFEVPLVVLRAPIVLEPVDEQLEWLVVYLMEVESFRTDLDEFF